MTSPPPPFPNNLSLRQLRAFAAVAQESSITRAAARLNLTPSALSMLIRSMEEELGLSLFDRTTRRLVLTGAGQAFLPTVERIFSDLGAGLRDLRQHQLSEATQLRVAAPPLLSSTLLPQVIGQLRAQHPEIRVALADVPVDAVPALVRQGQVDLAVCTAHSDYADLSSTPLYVDKLMLVCPQTHPFALQQEVAWQQIVDEPLIVLQRGSGLRTLFDEALGRWEGRLQIAHEVSHVTTAIGLVANSEGVCALPSYAISRAQGVASHPLDGAVAAVPLVKPIVERHIVALTAPGAPLGQAAQTFVRYFRQVTHQH